MPCASAIYKQPRWSTQGYPFLHPINTRNADPRFLGSAPASFLRQQGVSPRRPALPQVYWSGIPLNAPAVRACQRGLRFECCGSTTPNLEAEATPSAATGSHDLSGALSNERGPAIRSSEAVRLAGARPPDGRSGYTLTGQTIEQRGHGGRVLAAELATDEIVRGRIDFDAVGHYARRDNLLTSGQRAANAGCQDPLCRAAGDCPRLRTGHCERRATVAAWHGRGCATLSRLGKPSEEV